MVRLVEQTALCPAQHRRVTALLYLLVLPVEIKSGSGIFLTSGIISRKLQLPFCVEIKEKATGSKSMDKSYKREEDILEHDVARRSIRLSWNCRDAAGDSAADLILTPQDIRFAQLMSLEQDLKLIEQQFKQATDHYSFEKGIVAAGIMLQVYPDEFTRLFTSTSTFVSTFARFFQTKPNQIKDEKLLIKILEFSSNLIRLVPEHSFVLFVQDQLSDINCPLFDYITFQINSSSSTREQAATTRVIVNHVAKLGLKTLNAKTFNLFFSNIVKRFCNSRNSNNSSSSFFDLPFIQLLTKLLAKLTSDYGQSGVSIEVISNWFQIIPELVSIIVSFYHGAGGSSQSYMGKSVISNSATTILNLIDQIRHENWESCLLHNDSLVWISYLIKFRCETIRLCSIGILSSLTDSETGFEIVASTFGSSLYQVPIRVVYY